MNKFKAGDVVMRVRPPVGGFETDMKVGDVDVVTKATLYSLFLGKFTGMGHDPKAFVLVTHNFENI